MTSHTFSSSSILTVSDTEPAPIYSSNSSCSSSVSLSGSSWLPTVSTEAASFLDWTLDFLLFTGNVSLGRVRLCRLGCCRVVHASDFEEAGSK